MDRFISSDSLSAVGLFLASVAFCVTIINHIPYTTTVRDIGHYLIPRWPNSYIPELYVLIQTIAFLYVSEEFTVPLRQLAYFLFIRGMTMWITILPSLKKFSPISFYGLFGGHNDYLPFSGHMAFSHLLSMYIAGRTTSLVYICDIGMIYTMLAMRRHYTIELLASIFFIRNIVQMW